MGLNVIILGGPGAGKGTQAALFALSHGLSKISTGDILRQGVKDRLPKVLLVKEKMDRGELADDDTIIEIVQDRLGRSDTSRGFVLDGFPRNVAQAHALDSIMEKRAKGALLIVDIVVPNEELARRLSSRRICSVCGMNAEPLQDPKAACQRCRGVFVSRTDDTEAVVLERLRIYSDETKPLVEYYGDRPTFFTVDGKQAPEQVALELNNLIDTAAARSSTVVMEAQGEANR